MSFFITEKSPLGIYVGLLGAFREIQRRTQIDGPYLIHENHFYSQGPSEETGSFVIDKYIGPKTSFNCFALYPGNTENGYIKSISLEDKKGNKFKSIVDSMAYYHILSLYNVPFELDQNVGMNWTYLIERLAAPLDNSGDNEHIVQITSRPRKVDDFINVHFFTNLNTHSSEVSNRRPIKFFVELKLNEVPVLDARVKVQIHVINLSGHKTESVWVELLDNGNGDPDMSGNDGIYSRYLTDFSLKEGRYSISVHVNDNQGRAFSFQKERSYGGRSCCKGGDSNEFDSIINQKLGSFSRILTGDSFRLHSILDSDSMPPSRILDLAVNVHRDTHELEFLWTAPGDDYDRGQVTAYKLYSSPSVGSFYSSLNTTTLLGEIAASKIAGRRESHRIKVSDFNKNLFYTLVPIDGQGNTGAVSNVRGAFMPSPEKESKLSKGDSAAALVDSDSDSHDVVVVNHKKPDKIIVFLAIGVLAFVVICVISVISIIVLLNRRKKSGGDNLSAEDQSIYGDSDDHHEYHPTIAPSSVYDEQELMKEFEKRHFLTSSNLTDSNTQYSDRNYPYSINNTIHSSWTKNQPMIQRAPLPQPPPLYAVPVPRSQRPRFNDHLCTSSPQTPSSSMNSGNTQPRGETMANQSEPIYNNQTLQNLVDTLTQEFANENAMSYLEGTTTYMDHYYSNLYNTEERLSQSSSNTTADGQTPQKKDGNIKSILKKRDQSSNEHLTPISGSNSSHSSQERFENDDEKNREIEERLWADLSPTRVFLETSFESKFEGMRPPVIQEMTEEEEDDQPPTNPHQPVELLVTERQEEDLPPPPTSLELAGSLETFTTPVKIADVSLSSGLSERKRRNITQV